MKTNYVLVDYENVQPNDLSLLRSGPFRIKLFLGPNQAKIPVALAITLQSFGDRADYVPLETAGANALDFHIAYYIGALSCAEPTAFFHVISKDTGFDPLIRHLKTRGVLSQRSPSIAEMPIFKTALTQPVAAAPVASSEQALLAKAVGHLSRLKAARPRTLKTLTSTLKAAFGKEASSEQLDGLCADLVAEGVITTEGTKVSYRLPKDEATAVKT